MNKNITAKFKKCAWYLLIVAGGAGAFEYPFTELTEYSHTNTWMSGDQTNKLIFRSTCWLEAGMKLFQTTVKNQTDETFNEARHYGAGWVAAGAAGWNYEINPSTNFLRFYNGFLDPHNQQVFLDGTILTQDNQVAIVPFEMDNDEGGSRTGYALGPQMPEPAALALLLIGAGLLSARRED